MTKRRDQESASLRNDLGWILQVRREGIDDIPKARRRIAHAVGNMNPALRTPDRHRAGTVLALGDCVISPDARHLFLINDRIRNVIAHAKPDAPAAARLNEVIHGPGIEGILSIDKRRVQDHIALLGTVEGPEVGQTFPGHQILCAHNPGRRRCR